MGDDTVGVVVLFDVVISYEVTDALGDEDHSIVATAVSLANAGDVT